MELALAVLKISRPACKICRSEKSPFKEILQHNPKENHPNSLKTIKYTSHVKIHQVHSISLKFLQVYQPFSSFLPIKPVAGLCFSSPCDTLKILTVLHFVSYILAKCKHLAYIKMVALRPILKLATASYTPNLTFGSDT